jgi:hypothetical protein
MARSSAVTVENNFSRGLITEATAMNYPENSVVEADNCVFAKNGRVIRRYGIDFELNWETISFEDLGVMGNALAPEDYYDELAITEYEWTTVNNNGNISFLVVQIGNLLTFYQISDTNEISNTRKSFTVDLGLYQVEPGYNDEGQYVASERCSFSSGFGYLFVTHPLCNPFYIRYDEDTDTIENVQIDIKIRDFERIDDDLEIDTRPSTLTNAHKYNLYNQGWYAVARNAVPTTINVLTYWDNTRTDFPSNADVWWVFKNASELVDSTRFDTTSTGNTPAPSGHFIYNAFNIDRNSSISVTGLDSPSTSSRPGVCSFYAGRVWYAGTKATDFASKIYFSKIVEGTTDFGRCYQMNDPTSEELSDLLETDGGVINIPDVAQVLKMLAVGTSLFVFATNGTWRISGPNGVFQANDYSVDKISSASITAPDSVVLAEGLPFWWDKAGIYNIQFDQTSNQAQVLNVSEQTIQTLINNIPDENLQYVKGVYNNINKTIHWVYKSTSSTTNFELYSYNKLLVLNLTSQSFSPQTISTETPKVVGLTFTSKSNNDPLIDQPSASLVKFLTVGDFGNDDRRAFTISQFNNTEYYDWKSFNTTGIDFSSYFITGYRVRGELLKKFQSNYVVVISSQEPNASCFIQGIWDYSNDPFYGRFTTTQQIFKSDTTKDYSRRKLKMRGNGYSLQFKFYSESGKPFTLIGWATSDSGNQVP